MTARLVVALTAYLLVASCDSPTRTSDIALAVEMDAATYAIDEAAGFALVSYAVVNNGSAPVFVAGCNGFVAAALDRREGDAWVTHPVSFCHPSYDTTPVEIAPGETHESARGISDTGEFRLRIGIRSGGRTSWTVVSAGFAVE